jgi:hypothetical protein
MVLYPGRFFYYHTICLGKQQVIAKTVEQIFCEPTKCKIFDYIFFIGHAAVSSFVCSDSRNVQCNIPALACRAIESADEAIADIWYKDKPVLAYPERDFILSGKI